MRPRLGKNCWIWMATLALCGAGATTRAQHIPVSGQVEIVRAGANPAAATGKRAESAAGVAIWLVAEDDEKRTPAEKLAQKATSIVQRNKSFEPHVTVVEVGSFVQFPNKDPFFHNVFSLFNGKRFDLGLYEAGQSSVVHFDRVGISYLFCNIHPEMSGVVIAVPTPYFAVTDDAGKWSIAKVPNGRYRLHVWDEKAIPDDLAELEEEIAVSDEMRNLGLIRVHEIPAPLVAHKNKYGKDYPPSSSTYTPP